MQRPPFPAAIDNTMRSTIASCDRKGLLRFFLGYAPIQPSIHLHAGIAFAKGLEVTRKAFFADGLLEDDAIALGWAALIQEFGDFEAEYHGPPTQKNPHRMGEALVSYFDEYRLPLDDIRPHIAADGRPCLEFNFGIPLPLSHPESGQPIIYCGRFDMLGEANQQLFVVDEKTTTQLGQYWARRYELSAQFTGYCWAAQQYGYPVVGAIIRGVGILKSEIKHAGMPLLRPQFLIDEWYRQLLKDVERTIYFWKATDWEATSGALAPWATFEPDFADACGAYGGCEFLSVCQIAPESREKLLEINFAKRQWEPLRFAGDAE